MPRLNVYKAAPTKKDHVLQTYYVGGLNVVVYKDGGVMIGYPGTATKAVQKLNFKPKSNEALWLKKMVKAK